MAHSFLSTFRSPCKTSFTRCIIFLSSKLRGVGFGATEPTGRPGNEKWQPEDQRPGAPGATGARPLESGEDSHPRPSQCMEVLIACNQYVIRGSLVHWDCIDPEDNMKMIEKCIV